MNKPTVCIIGAGFGGLSAACYLAKAGYKVTIIEKNSWLGGRLQVWGSKGFTFDIGPSWYWMPEVLENFFADFNLKRKDHYQLVRLNPSYRVYFEDECVDLPINQQNLYNIFDKYEPGAGKTLITFLEESKTVYSIAMKNFVRTPYETIYDIFRYGQILAGLKLLKLYNGFLPVQNHIESYFRHPKLFKLLTFPIFFLGESAANIPSIYCMMNYADYRLGTWYPLGGFGIVAKTFYKVAEKLGVEIITGQEVTSIIISNNKAVGIDTANGVHYDADIIISNADYHFTETKLLPEGCQSYSKKYWQKRKMAPSALLICLGLNKKIPGLEHHTLFFENDWKGHNDALFSSQKWPDHPLFYVSAPSKTDPSVAPPSCEALTILVPLASGLKDNLQHRNKLTNSVLAELEKKTNTTIKGNIVTQKIYCLNDFVSDYHAYKGNAYGLGHTLNQTALFRPRFKSKKIKNLYYCGQFTIPGIGLPMVVLSGKIVADYIVQKYVSSARL